VTSLSDSSQGEVGDNREKWENFWEKSIFFQVGQVLFLVSCPMGQVEKYVNVEACICQDFTPRFRSA
jgi:hypothetical protein